MKPASHPARKTFDAEGKLLNDTLRHALQEKFEPYLQHSDLRGGEYAHERNTSLSSNDPRLS
jgi:hypothetical protein